MIENLLDFHVDSFDMLAWKCPDCGYVHDLNLPEDVDFDGFKVRMECDECDAVFLSRDDVMTELRKNDNGWIQPENLGFLQGTSWEKYDEAKNNPLRLPWTFSQGRGIGDATGIVDCTGKLIVGYNMDVEWCELDADRLRELVELVNGEGKDK